MTFFDGLVGAAVRTTLLKLVKSRNDRQPFTSVARYVA